MTTIISQSEMADFYKGLNELTTILGEMQDGEYRSGEQTRMAQAINGLRRNALRWTKIQEDILRTEPVSGETHVDNSFSHLFDDCERHGLYVSEDACPGCDNEQAGHVVTPWEEDREERQRDLDAEQDIGPHDIISIVDPSFAPFKYAVDTVTGIFDKAIKKAGGAK